MMRLNMIGKGLMLFVLAMLGGLASAKAASATEITPKVPKYSTAANISAKPAPSFIPANFNAPTLVETAEFRIVPLGPDLVKIDFDA